MLQQQVRDFSTGAAGSARDEYGPLGICAGIAYH
jgi:hypothetical protein